MRKFQICVRKVENLDAVSNAVGLVASVFGYTTEYILNHSVSWLVWACRAAARQRKALAGVFAEVFLPSVETTEETEENLENIGIKYE
ncbi:hypothetical protein [Elusimicrobium minutum]|uniref:hypothetical protein n=1 Tax=Elusimicrobium minutum TaxID=423605 RepID=UPI0001616BAD|nr:hypothetical protein [Elusimicrobium minutum]